MFESNLNDNDVVKLELPYPIVARYIRINPQRWQRFISLRAEFYGCRFGKLWAIAAALVTANSEVAPPPSSSMIEMFVKGKWYSLLQITCIRKAMAQFILET